MDPSKIERTIIFHAVFSSADFFFQNQIFQKILSGILSEHQTVWIQIRPTILLGLIWIQTVCKGFKQMTPVGKELMDNATYLALPRTRLVGVCVLSEPKIPEEPEYDI